MLTCCNLAAAILADQPATSRTSSTSTSSTSTSSSAPQSHKSSVQASNMSARRPSPLVPTGPTGKLALACGGREAHTAAPLPPRIICACPAGAQDRMRWLGAVGGGGKSRVGWWVVASYIMCCADNQLGICFTHVPLEYNYFLLLSTPVLPSRFHTQGCLSGT